MTVDRDEGTKAVATKDTKMALATKSTKTTKGLARFACFVNFVSFVASKGSVSFVAFVLCVIVVAPLAAQLSPRPTRPQVVPPQGVVRQVIFKSCTNCHGIDDYAYNALDRAGWDALIASKHRGLDVALAAQDRAVLLDWLEVRFGPATKPFPRTYVAREVTTFFTDTEAEALLKQSCASCHGVERVTSARFSPDRWRVITVDMRERGARLQDEELERLVEWLGRTKGTNDSDRQ